MERLTADPEEAKLLAFLARRDQIESFSDSRANQGRVLRASLARSLAEGPHSLWGGRGAADGRSAAPASSPAAPAAAEKGSSTPARSPDGSSGRLSSTAPRPGTAPAVGRTSSLKQSNPRTIAASAGPVPRTPGPPDLKLQPSAPAEGNAGKSPTQQRRDAGGDKGQKFARNVTFGASAPGKGDEGSAKREGKVVPADPRRRSPSPERTAPPLPPPGDWKHAGCVSPPRRPPAVALTKAAAERMERGRQRHVALKPVPANDQWAPQILAFIKDRWEEEEEEVGIALRTSQWGNASSEERGEAIQRPENFPRAPCLSSVCFHYVGLGLSTLLLLMPSGLYAPSRGPSLHRSCYTQRRPCPPWKS